MAWDLEGTAITVTMAAGGDLSSDQYKFVKVSAANTVILCTGATDNPLGILLNKPGAAGREALVLVAGIGKVIAAAATVSNGTIQLGTDGNGKAEAKTVTGTGRVVAQPLNAASGANEVITVAVNCLNPFETA